MSDIKKIINDGYHICVNLNMFLEISKYSNFKLLSAKDFMILNYYGFFEPSLNMCFIDKAMKDNHIKVFLTYRNAIDNSVIGSPSNIYDGWSPILPIDKINRFLKLKAFI